MDDSIAEAWKTALERVRAHVPRAPNLEIDAIDAAAKNAGLALEWRPLEGAGRLEDVELWKRIEAELNWAPEARVTLVADACYARGRGPLELEVRELPALLANFPETHQDTVFDFDVVLVSETGALFVHEGTYAISRRTRPNRPSRA